MGLKTALLAGAVMSTTLLLTACGGSSSVIATQAARAGSGDPRAQASAPGSGAASPEGSTDVVSSDANPVNGGDFCAFLESVLPKLTADGPGAGALADLTVGLSGWIEAHPEQKPRTASDLDEASTASCTATRSQVLAGLGAASFRKAFEG